MSDIQPYLSDCTLWNAGQSEGDADPWTLSWKCGENYRLMMFTFKDDRVANVEVIAGPPWLIRRNVDQIRFPQIAEID